VTKPRLLDLFCGAGGAAMGTETELAWAAGFFDGEGSISVRRDSRPGRKPALLLDIEQTDQRPLLRFHDAVRAGSLSRRPDSRGPNRKRLYRLHAGDKGTRRIIAALWPWLSEPKREQFIACLRNLGELP
jgi:hypothetical protein